MALVWFIIRRVLLLSAAVLYGGSFHRRTNSLLNSLIHLAAIWQKYNLISPQRKRRSPQVLGKLAGLWHFFNHYLKKHMRKSYIATACAVTRWHA
jgi:hypothetical protein